MNTLIRFAVSCVLASISINVYALQDDSEGLSPQQTKAVNKTKGDVESDLKQFGFGPAFFVINYDREVLKDSKDVGQRGDDTITATGTKWNASVGLETHYDIPVYKTIVCTETDKIACDKPEDWKLSTAYTISPFLGIYDIENGINGLAAGFIFGVKKDRNLKKEDGREAVFNVGIG